MKVNIETERSDLFDVSILIAMRIHIKGKVSEERLMLAFENAVKSHEILGTKVCIDEDGSAYYLISDDEEKTTGANGISFETSDWMLHSQKNRFR